MSQIRTFMLLHNRIIQIKKIAPNIFGAIKPSISRLLECDVVEFLDILY